MAVEVDGAAWTLRADGDRVVVEGGMADGARTLVLTRQQLADLADDQVTPMGWFASGALAGTARLETLLDWWLLVRGALDGVAPHVAGDVVLRDGDGSPLDPTRSFRPDDDPAAMRSFLEEAGFLHLTGVFTGAEMAAVSADMDREAPGYTQGDGRSWWARTEDGADRLVRMQGFDERSGAVADLVADPRLLRLGGLTGDGHRWGGTGFNRIEALVKPIGVVDGISDVPWHKDCSLGRHSYECCSLTVGVSVTGADAGSGQLRVVAGSHRALVWPSLLRKDLDLPPVDLPTATGDVTVHLSCTLHMAQPPVAAGAAGALHVVPAAAEGRRGRAGRRGPPPQGPGAGGGHGVPALGGSPALNRWSTGRSPVPHSFCLGFQVLFVQRIVPGHQGSYRAVAIGSPLSSTH